MATVTADTSGLWSTNGTWDTDSPPANGDTVVINAGVAVQVDSGCDHDNDSIVLAGITITSSATTPGRIYWKDDAVNGTGNIACSGDIAGTDAANYGQLVATADGTLADTDPLSYTYSAIIQMSSTGSVDCTYLDVNMLPDEPTNFYVTPYLSGSQQDFNAATAVSVANDTIEIEDHGLSDGDKIGFYAAGNTLPTPLVEGRYYYVRASTDDGAGGSADTFKVAEKNTADSIIDITAVGSGTCSIYEGADTSNPVPVLEDVTSDNWTNGDTIVLVDVQAGDYDQQHNIKADTIASGQITLSTAPDAAQNPGARINLSTMNCSILHSSTSGSQNIVENGSDNRFGEIRASNAACVGTTFYCYGIDSGSNHTATTISGCSYGINSGSGHTVTTISGCNRGIYYGSNHTVTTISGCSYGIEAGFGHTVIMISGCSYGIHNGSGHTATTINGCNIGINNYCYSHTVTTISLCIYGIRYGYDHTVTTISGCTYGMRYGYSHTVTTIRGCSYGIYSGSGNRVSNLSGNITDIDETYFVYASGGIIPAVPDNDSLNQDGEVSQIWSEHHQGVYGAQASFQSFGYTSVVDAGDGDPIPAQRSGGSTTLICIDNLQSNLSGAGGSGSADNKVIAWLPRSVRVWATASESKTYKFYVQSTFAITAAADLVLRATYHDSGSDTEWTTVESSDANPATVRSGLTDWDDYVEVTVNPSRTGWITFDIELRAYDSDGEVYIDPLMVIS